MSTIYIIHDENNEAEHTNTISLINRIFYSTIYFNYFLFLALCILSATYFRTHLIILYPHGIDNIIRIFNFRCASLSRYHPGGNWLAPLACSLNWALQHCVVLLVTKTIKKHRLGELQVIRTNQKCYGDNRKKRENKKKEIST